MTMCIIQVQIALCQAKSQNDNFIAWIHLKLTKEKVNCLNSYEIRIGKSWRYEKTTSLRNGLTLQWIHFARAWRPIAMFVHLLKKLKKRKRTRKVNKNKLINQTLHVSLICTGKYMHSFNLHEPHKFGRYQWTRTWISQHKTTKRLVS